MMIASENVLEKKIINYHKLGIATNDINKIVKFIAKIFKKRDEYSKYLKNLKEFVKNNDDSVILKKLYTKIKYLI